MKRTSIGGQAVIEGVMMRSEQSTGIAVRQEPGNIVTDQKPTKSMSQKHGFFRVPIIRGVVNFVEMLILGVKTITDAAKMYDPEISEEEETTKAERFIAEKTNKSPMDVAIFFAVIIAVVLAIGLFFILPNLLTGWLTSAIEDSHSIFKNLIDGAVRVCIFVVYLVIITNMRDIKRMFGYHGAEHKTINCFEHEEPLTVENVRKHSRLHPRCGTSFLLIVMIISILLFSVLGWSDNWAVRIALRLAMLPIVAGVSYEVLKLLAKKENAFTGALRKPGMALQRLTTREPDDAMLEVAIVSFRLAENEMTAEEIEALAQSYEREPQVIFSEKEKKEAAKGTE